MRPISHLAVVSCVAIALCGVLASAQTCLLSPPSAPPRAKTLVVNLPGDGGTTGCTAYATCDTCKAAVQTVAIGNAKCATAVLIADQSVANDNGWADGGAP